MATGGLTNCGAKPHRVTKKVKKSYIPKVSDKQKEELALRRRVKAELMKDQLANTGYIFCQECNEKPDWRGIQLRHRIPLSRGGKTSFENCSLWCGHCHATKDHHIKEV